MIKTILLFLPFILSPTYTFERYDMFTGEIFCEIQCLHEEAHALDTGGSLTNWISSSLEFRTAVDEFLEYCDQPFIYQSDIPYCNFMVSFPGFGTELKKTSWTSFDYWLGGWGGYLELYATIYAFDGEIPITLKEFYK